jgi:glycosyltransferase involved in cell wall biosynthesis
MLKEMPAAADTPELSLVMPCYNEESIVSHTISRLLTIFSRSGYRLEIIAVDNGSHDRTGEIILDWASRNPAVVHHRVEQNAGYGNGILEGIPKATAPWVGTIAADGQVDAEDVLRLFEVVRSTDTWVLAKARRCFRMDGLARKCVSVAYNLMFRLLWPGVASIDINGIPKIMPREALATMCLQSKDWFLDPEIMIKSQALGIRVIEFNVFARLRGAGVSHVKAGTCWEFFRNLMKYRLDSRWQKTLIHTHSTAEGHSPADMKI